MKGGFTKHFNEYDYGDDNPYLQLLYTASSASSSLGKGETIDISPSAQQSVLSSATAVRDSGSGDGVRSNDAAGNNLTSAINTAIHAALGPIPTTTIGVTKTGMTVDPMSISSARCERFRSFFIH